jgi:hypothetical protein
MAWQCFMLEPTDRVRRELRRYDARYPHEHCEASGMGYHNAGVRIEDGPVVWREHGRSIVTEPIEWQRDDPRWPTHCACGYEFTDDDHWQLAYHMLYRLPDGTETILREAPPGAMWDATWLADVRDYRDRSPDGLILTLMLPDGYEWLIDGPSANGPGWTRTGTPPLITARPSILSPRYHGWLTDGVLSADLEGRTYSQR